LKKTEVLLVHLARDSKIVPLVNLLAMGLLPIAQLLNSNGISAKIIHENLERQLDSEFSLIKYLKTESIKICCFSLQWHQQAKKVMDLVGLIRREIPNIVIVLGGFTASVFAQEIMEKFGDVDYVIKGDGERPLLLLSQFLLHKESIQLEEIPNLFFRSTAGKSIENKKQFQATTKDIEKASFTNFKLVKNGDTYLRLKMNSPKLNDDKTFYFSTGRGCNAHCLYCAGSKLSQKKYSNRPKVEIFSNRFVIQELKTLKKYGIKYWNSCFDPVPNSDYYPELFREIRKNKIKIHHYFDCFSLPTREFVDEFKKTFGKESSLNISPETGSDKLRARLRSFRYKTSELMESLDYINKRKLNCSVYFSTGLPFETKADFEETKELIRVIKNRFPNFKIYIGVIDLEPGSTLFDNQEAFRIKSKIKNFEDLLNAQKQIREANYSTDVFSAEEIERNCEILRELAGF
jgi:radical SAM superfamily enzyme YgiQ (UPF0313 family)